MYSMACCSTQTLLIFLTGAAVGTCLCKVSKPLLTVCTLFLSRVFLLIVFKSSWGLITYPWIGWIAISLLRGPITTKELVPNMRESGTTFPAAGQSVTVEVHQVTRTYI